MAQTDTPFGFKPVGMIDGSPWNGKIRIYYTDGAAAIYKGSPVILLSTSDALGHAPGCAIATTETADILGVAWTFGNTRFLTADVSDLTTAYKPADSASGYIGVIDDPRVVFEIQEDNASSATLAATDIGLNVKPKSAMESGSTVTGLSSCEVSSGSGATAAASYPLRLHGIVDREDNIMGSSYCKWLVTINNHSLGGGRAGV